MTGESGDPARALPERIARSLQRTRILNLIMGGFLLLTSAVLLVIVVTAPSSDPGLPYIAFPVVTALAGAVLLVQGFTPIPTPVVSTEAPRRAVDEEDGWMRLGPAGSVSGPQSWFALRYTQLPLAVIPIALFVVQITAGAGLVVLLAVFGVITAAMVIAQIVVRGRNLSPWVRSDGSAIRQRSHEIPASDLTGASYFFSPLVSVGERNLVLILTGRGGFRAVVGLRRKGRLVLTDAETEALVGLLERSSIALPRDPYDPQGRFAKALQGTNLDKEDAVAMVEHPPGDGEPIRPTR